jgi:hypothetical protein
VAEIARQRFAQRISPKAAITLQIQGLRAAGTGANIAYSGA